MDRVGWKECHEQPIDLPERRKQSEYSLLLQRIQRVRAERAAAKARKEIAAKRGDLLRGFGVYGMGTLCVVFAAFKQETSEVLFRYSRWEKE